MKWKRAVSLLVLAVFLLAPLLGAAVLAQSSENYRIGRYVMVSGASESSSANYVVRNIVGQSISAVSPLSGGNYVVKGGFLPGTGANQWYRVYLPLMVRH
jgi:hypothetical protein